VHAGKPEQEANYYEAEVDGKVFYIHNDLLDKNIEIFLSVSEESDNLLAKEY